jgi:hypothetical protein
VLVFKELLFYPILASKHQITDYGNSDMAKESNEVLPLSERVKILNLIRRKHGTCGVWYCPWFQASSVGPGIPCGLEGTTVSII